MHRGVCCCDGLHAKGRAEFNSHPRDDKRHAGDPAGLRTESGSVCGGASEMRVMWMCEGHTKSYGEHATAECVSVRREQYEYM